MPKWPSVFYTNIEKFLCQINESSDLLLRLESDYKKGKAYRYYKCEFVKEIFYHLVSSKSKYCILKICVTPSKGTSNTAHHVWAIIEKDGEKRERKIYSAYGTCTAGLLGCSNHVTAMLFRVEAAAICSGATKPSSTSMLACWNVPTGCKTTLVYKPLADIIFHENHFKKRKTIAQKIECHNDYYKSFNVTGEYETFLQDPKEHRSFLYNTLKDDASGSCFI